MADSAFVSADISKIADFERDSADVIKEFAAIKAEFERINSVLLGTWKGSGADAYKYETDHILEKIGSVEDVLNAINEGAVKSIRTTYSDFDDEMGEFNTNPGEGEE
ncbi:MAG: WXG100 family type VII secretion target [Ruminococcus sp.]|uniref:WXG100 family type VII secretion target n=1 Tax=uncultured Ruminococcus sp. TaxID=165186 RepID=UPI0015632572|nr:hypothetical protein [uncultured Ruminococcus sp.]MCR4861845.1 WXG100 family type VII secretion target [Ruminococcus sp.]